MNKVIQTAQVVAALEAYYGARIRLALKPTPQTVNDLVETAEAALKKLAEVAGEDYSEALNNISTTAQSSASTAQSALQVAEREAAAEAKAKAVEEAKAKAAAEACEADEKSTSKRAK